MDLQKDYYLGLDCGTGSVGWAVTDTDYRVLAFRGKSMWGSRLFETALTAADRRMNRCARRRYLRSKQRIDLLDELLEEEIAKTDPEFIQRVKDSSYKKSDKTEVQKNSLFNDKKFKDNDFFNKYPTIFHLRKALIDNPPDDIRFLYLAIHHILKNRGHFLFPGQSLSSIQSLKPLLEKMCCLSEDELGVSIYINDYEEAERCIKEYKGNQRVFKLEEIITTSDSKVLKKILKTLSGQKVNASDLFDNEELIIDGQEIKIDFQKADFETAELVALEDLLSEESYLLLEQLKGIFDWSLLSRVMAGCVYLSDAKINQYNDNKVDLKNLKYIYKTYFTEKEYEEFFHSEKLNTFSSYIGGMYDQRIKLSVRRTKMDDFYKVVKKMIESCASAKNDPIGQQILNKIADGSFFNLLISSRNSLIPYQVHYMELAKILENAEKQFSFLTVKDDDGLTISDKIKSIMTFRIPYYVGPLVDVSKPENARKFAWMTRKSEGKIYPWNFEEKVDIATSATNFITKMVNNCTYLPNEKVLPKNSLLYSEFMVLNELNNLKINSEKPSVEQKQEIVEKLFKKYKKVTQKRLLEFIKTEGWYPNNTQLQITGIDGDFKTSLTSYIAFKNYLNNHVLSKAEVEEIIFYNAVFESGGSILEDKITSLIGDKVSNEDLKKILAIKFKGWGRFSRKFLEGQEGTELATGEVHSIMYFLQNTNKNLMELLSKDYDFLEGIEELQTGAIENLDYSCVEQLSISPSVKRQIWQTLKIVKEVEKIMGCPPKKVFMEFAREEREKVRTVSRRDNLLKLYDSLVNPSEEDLDLKRKIVNCTDTQLAKNDRLFLYYTQLGRCMYSGKPIDISELTNSNIYDIDHIIPQSKIKDDSLNNKCLVLRTINNGVKNDIYPITDSIQNTQKQFWKHLLDCHLINENKYNRLIRTKQLSESELSDFINRQLIETQQSTKACAAILKQYFKEGTKIVYSKAGNVSDFKNEYFIPKVRIINDLHHAKDAYLNIVVGNCFDTKFSRPGFIQSHEQYNLSHVFKYSINGAWDKDKTIKLVKEQLDNNDIRFTRQTFCKSGQLFDLMPLKGTEKNGMIPRKNSDPKLVELLSKAEDKDKCIEDWVKQYGGYNSLAISYFALIKYTEKKKDKAVIISIPVMIANQIKTDDELLAYASNKLKFANPRIIIRKIPVNTLFEYNGFRLHLSGKAGSSIFFKNATPLYLTKDLEKYTKNLEKVNNRKKRFPNTFKLYPEEDKISKEENLLLYDELTRKLGIKPFSNRPGGFFEKLQNGRSLFIELNCEEQVFELIEILQLFGTNSTLSNLSAIGCAKTAGGINISPNLDISKNKYVIINQSVTGLFEKTERLG